MSYLRDRKHYGFQDLKQVSFILKNVNKIKHYSNELIFLGEMVVGTMAQTHPVLYICYNIPAETNFLTVYARALLSRTRRTHFFVASPAPPLVTTATTTAVVVVVHRWFITTVIIYIILCRQRRCYTLAESQLIPTPVFYQSTDRETFLSTK